MAEIADVIIPALPHRRRATPDAQRQRNALWMALLLFKMFQFIASHGHAR